jgi:hypothetical protein
MQGQAARCSCSSLLLGGHSTQRSAGWAPRCRSGLRSPQISLASVFPHTVPRIPPNCAASSPTLYRRRATRRSAGSCTTRSTWQSAASAPCAPRPAPPRPATRWRRTPSGLFPPCCACWPACTPCTAPLGALRWALCQPRWTWLPRSARSTCGGGLPARQPSGWGAARSAAAPSLLRPPTCGSCIRERQPHTCRSRSGWKAQPFPPTHPHPPLQAADASGETGDDGYASVGGTTPAALRAWLRHMREFTYQVGSALHLPPC